MWLHCIYKREKKTIKFLKEERERELEDTEDNSEKVREKK